MLLDRDPATLSPVEAWLATIPPPRREEAIARFTNGSTAGEREAMRFAWYALWARPGQRLPEGAWDLLMIRAGRGYGKTRGGSEGVRRAVNSGMARAVTIVGPTAADARDVQIEGPESGLLAVHPPDSRPTYRPSTRILEWPNGAIGHVRSAEEPDSLRGLNSDLVWGDEPARWKSGREAWDNAMLGNRLGTPHSILTGTPRPLAWLKELETQPGTVVVTGSTYENIGNLAPAFISLILGRYEGTRQGQQELHAKYLEDVEGALWRMSVIEASRFDRFDVTNPWGSVAAQTDLNHRLLLGLGAWQVDPRERRPWVTWVGVDPPGETAECGIVIATAPERARVGSDHVVVLDDMSVAGPPEVWGPRVVEAVHKWGAKGAVVERNQGGDMTRSTIHAADPNVVVEKVTATESKADRAEPVSGLYPRGWAHHYGHLAELETQMTTWVPDESKSPDRIDALAHVVTKLLRFEQIASASIHSPV